ncbi:MAG: carbamoyltransferase C-terminal domain-containing protein, partial [Alphaproteobacteria bacterium]
RIVGINMVIGPSVCLLDIGKVIFALVEERLNREKITMGFPGLALQYVERNFPDFVRGCDKVAVANLILSLFDKRQFHSRYHRKMVAPSPMRKLRDRVWLVRMALRSRFAGTASEAADRARVRDMVMADCPSLSLPLDDYDFVRHHDCHAGAAYFGLAESDAKPYLVLTLDGGGDRECATVQLGQGAAMRRVSATESGNSIGNVYSITTFLMGLTPHEHEYKLMGLAAYVPAGYRKRAAELFRPFVSIAQDDDLRFTHGDRPRTTEAHLALDAVLRRQRFDNVAGGLQQYTEDLVLQWVRNAIARTGVTDLLLSGGVFMNVSLNRRIAELPEVTSLAVFPSCGDETNSFGAAFTAHARHTGKLPDFGPFTLGPAPVESLDELEGRFGNLCSFRRVEDTAAETAGLLAEGKIVARCEGGMEFGARALGNRSILADPKHPDAVEKINASIKQRDFWMPFAPAILAEDLERYVVVPKTLGRSNPSPYMMVVMESRPERQDEMIAALHRFDKSARVQVVDRNLYPGFHRVISAFRDRTGRSCLLNTSFNVHGHPIVHTASEAIEVLIDSNLDAVILDGCVVTRKK